MITILNINNPMTQTFKPHQKVKRKWAYILQPVAYGISGCKCGNNNCKWSEYSKHLWCEKCNIDFIPEFDGVFDGPILLHTCGLLGIVFDRYNVRSKRVVKFESKEWDKTWP